MNGYFPHRGYPLPTDETDRLATAKLFDFLINPELTGADNQGLTRICELARTLLGVERAFVSLVLEDTQHFIAKANLEATSTPRDLAFCAHTITEHDPLVVPDSKLDPRFVDNPLTNAPLSVRFYAGTPLHFEGHAVGSFCVTGSKPRQLSDQELATLQTLAAMVLDQLRMLVDLRDLRQQAALLRQTEYLAQIGGWEVDMEKQTALWSEELYRIHDADPSEPVTFERLRDFYPNGEAERLGEAIERALATGIGFSMDVEFVTPAGVERCGRIMAEVVPRVNKPPRILGTFLDVTEQRRAEAKWKQAALHDPVTGLPNRARLDMRLEETCSQKESGVLLLVGLDNFKALNEARGRIRGDVVLRRLGERLVTQLGSEAFVARIGGDEFAILLPHVHSGHGILSRLREIHDVLEQCYLHDADQLLRSASIGVCMYPDDSRYPAEILQCSEIALRNAKSSGGGRVEYFAPELRKRIETKISTLADVRRGLEHDEFLMHYQPICDVDGHARGFEALMRWNHGQRGLLSPYHFMIAFEDSELSVRLGEVALRGALQQMHTWKLAGHSFGYVAINLSAAQLALPSFAEHVADLLAQFEVEPRSLMLEVTESVYLDGNREQLIRSLNALREIGVTFALDDFGTGYASLTHLKQFAIDRIKVDQSFVREIGKNSGDAAIVRAIVSLGKAMSMQVVAEGVETAEQLAFLQGLGCELIQGYYFAKPMPAADAITFAA